MELDTKLSLNTIINSVNIAEKLSEDDLNTIADYVHTGYSVDEQSRKGWKDAVEEWIKQAIQAKEQKNTPWPNAANVKFPLITTAALQFSARAYPALLPGVSPVRGRVIGYDPEGTKTERAIRVGKHMSYQLLEQMDDWEEEMDRLLFALPIVGCMFKKTYYSGVLQKNISELVYPTELVVNYWAKNLEEAERVTHVLRLTDNDIYERVQEGLYLDQELSKAVELDQDKTVTDKQFNAEVPNDDTLTYRILEQHCYLDLDQDGYKEPYIVLIDDTSKKILRIVARFNESDVKYTERNEIASIKPIDFFTKFSFVPSPDGSFYDIGFGILLGPINETINTVINQLLDAGTLSNMQSGFISKGIRIKGGEKGFIPGEWKWVNGAMDDLRKGLVPLPVREPSQVLFSLLGTMIESGERLSSVTEIMTGNIPGQNTKATVAMAAIEQGTKVFSSIYKRTHRSLTKEYKKLFRLNSIFLEEQEYFTILDSGQETGAITGKQDYDATNVDVVPASDANVATEQQRLAKIEALKELLSLGLINPQEFTKRYLEATEQPNIQALMDMPKKGPSLEEQKLEWDKQKFNQEHELEKEKFESSDRAARAKAILDLAKAEAEAAGTQLPQYMQQLELILAEEEGNQKLRQTEAAFEQKMAHQEAMNELKLQQSREVSNGASNE